MNAGPTPSRKSNDAKIAEQTVAAYELRLTGKSLREIGKELGLAPSTVSVRISDALRERVDPLVDHYRAMLLDRLDMYAVRAYKVMTSRHILVQQGKVIYDPSTGEPLIDSAPVLAAIDRLTRIAEAVAKLVGANAVIKADVTVTPVDPTDLALWRLVEDAKAKNAAEEARLRGEDPGASGGGS
ncbi:hypothetical protein Aph01nite_34500 [Acrocarpospora phusangensis]|uniref:RNA polymerase sigma factor 70 region 4 type 2 domain-containing protein n=1 Tax=Acrocarpospora phusangensis TaxID=1070424 RepID=A0A919QD21_9ACTN|nr:hypothetical protein [Acrocarpospora phusangensis]GIH25140.1 hypothetical protein Aph01nite_34500 [Acrocarpospora phusangensis]